MRQVSRDVIRSRMTEARRVLAGAIVHVDHTWGVSELVSTDWQRFLPRAEMPPDPGYPNRAEIAPFSLSVPCSSVRAETRIAMSKQVLGGPTHQ